MHKLKILSACLLASSCSSYRTVNLDYDVYRHPIVAYTKLNFLGVSKTPQLAKEHNDYILNALRSCGQYNKVVPLNLVIKVPTEDPESIVREYRRQLEVHQEARYVHGTLAIEIVKQQNQKGTLNTKVATTIERPNYQWYDSSGEAAHPQHQAFASEELGPEQSFAFSEEAGVLYHQAITLRATLFNRQTSTLIFDRTLIGDAWLSNYSKNPAFDRREFQSEGMRRLLQRLVKSVCPSLGAVQRSLFATKGTSPADRLVDRGVEAASNDQWDTAVDAWKKAVLIDRKNLLAHHNLGIFYERSGNLPAALEEFFKGRSIDAKADYKKSPRLDAYDQALDFLRPTLEPRLVEPRVYAVGPSGWVSILGGEPATLNFERPYAVYRMRARPATQETAEAMEWIEIGKIRLLRSSGAYTLGRVVQSQVANPIAIGDILFSYPAK